MKLSPPTYSQWQSALEEAIRIYEAKQGNVTYALHPQKHKGDKK